jgi:hypothetical protein
MTHQPAGTFHEPTMPGFTANLDQRTKRLEQRPQPGPYVPRFCLTATNPAPITEERRTGSWWPWRGAVDLEYVTIDAQAVGGETFVAVRRSAVDVVAVDLVEGLTRLGVDERWTPGDYLDLTIEGQVGHLLVQMWFRGEGGGGLVFSVPAGGGG